MLKIFAEKVETFCHPKLANFKIYSPGYQAISWGFNYDQIVDLQTALAQPIKIAALPVFFNDPDNFAHLKEFETLQLEQFDLILFEDIKINNQYSVLSWIKYLDIPNWLLCVGSIWADDNLHSKIIYNPYYSFVFLNWNPPRNTFPLQRPFLFDCLHGTRDNHRDYVQLALQESGLIDQGIVTYREEFNQWPRIQTISGDNLWQFPDLKLQWPYVSKNLNPAWEVSDVIHPNISNVVPWEIYNNTYFTLLTETFCQGDIFFMSKKIGKCCQARRLFVHFGMANWLSKFKSLGFETFESLLDESYDTIENNIQRWKQAFDQVKFLSKQDLSKVLLKAQPILDHNHNRLYKLRQEIRDTMADKIIYNLQHHAA